MLIQSVAAPAAIRPASALSFATPAAASATASPGAAAASSGSRDTPEKIQKAATDFEALLIAQMLKSVRESGGGMTGDADEQDETNSTMLELGEQQLAQALSSSGGLGIAKMVIAGLTNHANR
jgi:Rod binding domain-containing protein